MKGINPGHAGEAAHEPADFDGFESGLKRFRSIPVKAPRSVEVLVGDIGVKKGGHK